VRRFNIESLDGLRAEADRLGAQLPLDTELSILGEAVKIGPFETANRFAVHPMEGFDSQPDGSPSELSLRRYSRYAAGGSGLIWFEATAVVHEGRSNPGQLYLHEKNKDAFRHLVETTRRIARERYGREVVLVLQLTHSGRYSRPDGLPRPVIAHHSPLLDAHSNISADYPVVSDEYLDALQDRYLESARLAAEVGFDGVDVKTCHGYLVSGLLAARARPGKYGGCYENRTRFAREVVMRISRETPGLLLCSRFNGFDGIPYPYGWGADEDNKVDLAEPLRFARELVSWGVELLNVSIGNPRYNPHFGRPYEKPLAGQPEPREHPLAGIARFLSIVQSVQQAVAPVCVVAGAMAWLRHFMPYVAAGLIRARGAALIGQGRGAFAYPDSPRDILETGRMDPDKCCTTCSMCSQLMRDGGRTGCVVRDREIYGAQLRRVRRAAREREKAGGKESPPAGSEKPSGRTT